MAEDSLQMTERIRATTHTNAGILSLRFLAAHLLCLFGGVAISMLTQPLWSWLLYRINGREQAGAIPWAWYLFVLAPFYAVLSTLTVLVTYTLMTGATEKVKSWQRVLRITFWIHIVILLFINFILGGRMLP